MTAVRHLLVVFGLCLLQACGGSGSSDTGGKGVSSISKTSAIASSESSSSAIASSESSSSSAVGSESSSNSSVTFAFSSISHSSVPADFPVGITQTLPVLRVTTNNAAPIQSKETYVTGQYTLVDSDETLAQGDLEIRGRGNSTWGWVKKPYRVKLKTSTEILGMPVSRHWVLLANYVDKTLMRNDIAFRFARSIGMEYSPRNRHVDLYLNGSYQGIYQLTEHIRVATDRVNIPELKVTDTDDEKITGGYLMEVDFRMHKDYCKGDAGNWESFCVRGVNMNREETFCVDSTKGMNPFCIDTPEDLLEDDWSAQRNYIETYIGNTETALFGSDFADEDQGYAAYIDVDSAIHYFLVNELFKNPDGAATSFYLYKKRNGKLFFGPIWDFDLAMGNAGYDNVEKVEGWHIRPAAWFNRLFQDPAFEARVKARWQVLKEQGAFEEMFEYAQARAYWLSAVQANNYAIWSVTDFDSWINHGSAGVGSYVTEVNELLRWQRERYQWLDEQFSK
jgi:hypothetical protein